MDADFMLRVQPPQAKMIDLSDTVLSLDVKTATNIWRYEELVKVFHKVETVEDPDKTFKALAEWPAISRLRIEMEPKFAARNSIEKGVRRRAKDEGASGISQGDVQGDVQDVSESHEANGSKLDAESREGQAEGVANG